MNERGSKWIKALAILSLFFYEFLQQTSFTIIFPFTMSKNDSNDIFRKGENDGIK